MSEEIHQTSPNAKIQWYQTWGRPYGDGDRCDEIPQVCTFDGTYTIFPNLAHIFTNVTTDYGHPERAFCQKFETFGLGQTNWAEIL